MGFCVHKSKLNGCYARSRAVIGIEEQSRLGNKVLKLFTHVVRGTTHVKGVLRVMKVLRA